MGLKQHVKSIVMRYKPLRSVYLSWRKLKFDRELAQRYGNMGRKDVFSSIYSNFAWGGGHTILLRFRLSR